MPRRVEVNVQQKVSVRIHKMWDTVLQDMRTSDLLKKYSVEKMLFELHKLRKVILQDGKEITTEITKKQKNIIEAFSSKLERVPTFLKN